MRRSGVGLGEVAQWDNLVRALKLASRGKRDRPDVIRFLQRWPQELEELQEAILTGSIELGRARSFRIRDPKPRLIHAPCFRERVLHHALMNKVGPILNRALVQQTYACRESKGPIRAVQRLQLHLRRFPWFVKIDIRDYFATIDHETLFRQICRKFKNEDLLDLVWRVIRSHNPHSAKGLPIGALTSQNFANFYLAAFDRWLLEEQQVGAMVRYMDDVVWMEREKREAKVRLNQAISCLRDRLGLEAKLEAAQINRSSLGVSFLGYKVLRGALKMTARRRRLYIAARTRWERAFLRGEITSKQLQAGMDSALSLTLHADSESVAAWRREQLQRTPLDGRLAEL